MISKERIDDLLKAGKVFEADLRKTVKITGKNSPLYDASVRAYKDRQLINQILEVYRDLKVVNRHKDIQIILDRIEEC